MVNWAWTGSRPPRSGLVINDVVLVTLDVARTVNPGDSIATGGSKGVDEIVMRSVLILKQVIDLRLITFTADKERAWDSTIAPNSLIDQSDEVIRGYGYLERDRKLVEWASFVRAMPMRQLSRDPAGIIVCTRGSGTAYTAHQAQSLNKLIAELPLRSAA